MNHDELRKWKIAGIVALSAIVITIPYYVARDAQRSEEHSEPAPVGASFVGRERCIECHAEAYELWLGSDHDNAMDVADEATVLGDFDDAEFEHEGLTSRFYRRDGGYFVHTEGPGGEMMEFEVRYTFGIEPLQQYLVPFPGGRLQALPLAWDTERQRWFTLNPDTVIAPDNWLHWTRNGQNWNGMCAECHSTHLRKNYDPASDSYDTTWSEIDVSCEACHGPGSAHVGWAELDPMGRPDLENYALEVNTTTLDPAQQVELCAPCHSRRSEIGDYDHAQADFLDFFVPSLLEQGVYHPDGQILEEDYVWGSFVQSKMYGNGVRCSDCHNVHSLALHREGNALCLQCHQADAYDTEAHHFHKKIHEGEPSDGALCVKCHMPEQPFMVIDYRADHSLRIPRPDLTETLGVPNACGQSGCHDDQPLSWSQDAYTAWYGTARKPHFGTTLAAAQAGDPGAGAGLVEIANDPLFPVIVRATALHALSAYPGAETLAAMQRALADDDPLLRHTAVASLISDDPAQLASLVAPSLFDPVRAVRLRAAATLAAVDREYLNQAQRDALDLEMAAYVASLERMLDFAPSGLSLGNHFAALGKADRAEGYYRKAIAVDNLFYPAKMNLAILLSGAGRDAEAEPLLRQVLDAYPEQHDAAYYLGLLLVGLDRKEEALAMLERAAEGQAQRPRVHYNRGLLLAQLGRDDEAESALRQAWSLERESVDYLYALIDFCARRGRLDEALGLAREMVAIHPQNPLGYQLKSALEERLRMTR
jgi:tetratricopeptide (TPR) repeat protein